MGKGGTVSRIATRVDAEAGIREEISFIGSGAERMFSPLHTPLSTPVGAVLICSSIMAELPAAYREEVRLSERCAQRGLIVRRFHYRSSGHSDGDSDDLTYESICRDALEVAEHLRDETGAGQIGFVGTRLGALVAATIGSRFPGSPVSFIEPVLDGGSWFKEISRARRIALMNEEGQPQEQAPPEDMLAILERDRSVDALGYRLNHRFLESVRPRRLLDELGSEPRPVQLVQVANRRGLGAPYQRFLEELEARGFPAVAATVTDEIAWWFMATRRHLIPQIGEAVVPWIGEQLVKEEAK